MRTYVIEGPYKEGTHLFGSSIAGKFQLIEYDEDDEIVGGAFFKTMEEARTERRRIAKEQKYT
tara:strand:- start:1405 stop:1593 length:189 start_codon:yes stop_codon:yes gene_type:complete